MITVISGTNRKNSNTRKIASLYLDLLRKNTEEDCSLLALEDLPNDFISPQMYEEEHQNQDLAFLQDQYFTPANKLVFVVPEYNGSFPGIFKLFIDAISIRNYKANFAGKKVGLIGVASGRAGNLRGLDHLTTSLNYLKMNVFHNRFPVAQVEKLLDDDGEFTDQSMLNQMEDLAIAFINY